MLHPKLGSKWSWQPTAFDKLRKMDIPLTVHGEVIHVNEEHHCFTAEAIVNGYKIRESFKF